MSLSSLNRIPVRPRGGVSRVELVSAREFIPPPASPGNSGSPGATEGPVSENTEGPVSGTTPAAALETNPAAEAATPAAAEWVFREDRASYKCETVGEYPRALVRHTLEMEFPACPEARRAVDLLAADSAEGVVAVVTLCSGERLVVGHSARFGAMYPLRLAKVASASGRTPADFPSIAVTLECTGAQ